MINRNTIKKNLNLIFEIFLVDQFLNQNKEKLISRLKLIY